MRFSETCGKGVQVHFKGANTGVELLVALKDNDSIIQKGGSYIQKQMQPTRVHNGIHRGNGQKV